METQKWCIFHLIVRKRICSPTRVTFTDFGRPLCWREAVARSFSPGQVGCSATEQSRWPHKLRLCRSLAQCSQDALPFQCWLLHWPRACGSWRAGGHTNSGCVTRLPSAARSLFHSSAGCSLGPGHVALGALGRQVDLSSRASSSVITRQIALLPH